MTSIRFYSAQKDKPYWIFSPLAPIPVVINDCTYSSIESFYQFSKYVDTDLRHAIDIKFAECPAEARRLGINKDYIPETRNFAHPKNSLWKEAKETVMRIGIYSKALQCTEFLETLLSTKERVLIFASPIDYFWGIGIDGTGQNRLGVILMDIRNIFAREMGRLRIHERYSTAPRSPNS
jgi:ribA/ribD-fused uncharacterized protein